MSEFPRPGRTNAPSNVHNDSGSISDSSCDSMLDISLDSIDEEFHEAMSYPTFKLVRDNLDKTVSPRYMRLSSQTVSCHYYHHVAVKDRVDIGEFSDRHPPPSQAEHVTDVAQSLLPSPASEVAIKITLRFSYVG